MIKYCETCNKIIDLENVYGSGRFCNINCKSKFNGLKAKPKPKQRKTIKCKACRKEFQVTLGSRRVFCSKECNESFGGNKSHPHSKETKNKISKSVKEYWSDKTSKQFCKECGKEISRGNKTGLCQKHYKHHFTEQGLQNLRKSGQRIASRHLNRSYNEILFCDLLKSHFKNVINNKAIFNGWDADIILPDLKVAILWNGPWHYNDIFGQLNKIQNRDKIKYSEIIKAGYMPYIVVDFTSKNDEKCKKELERFLEFAKMLK